MNLMQRISKFLKENPELSMQQINEMLQTMNLAQDPLPIMVKVGSLPNGVCQCYYQTNIRDIGKTREGLVFQEITPMAVIFKAPKSPLSLHNEIAQANITPEVWEGRYGGHAECQLKSVLKEQEQDLRDSGVLGRDEYQLYVASDLREGNPGFVVCYREPPAHDNSFARDMRDRIQLGIPGYGACEDLSDSPKAKTIIPVMHVGIKTFEFFYKAAHMARLNTPEKQDIFLEKVVNAAYQLPICMQHVEEVLRKPITIHL